MQKVWTAMIHFSIILGKTNSQVESPLSNTGFLSFPLRVLLNLPEITTTFDV